MINRVIITAGAAKDLMRVPVQITRKLRSWADAVETFGLEEVRKVPGFHDELLKGDRAGQRSIRLNHAYRAIYMIGRNGAVEFVSVEEVTKHKY